MESLLRDMKIKEALEEISVNTPKCGTYTFLEVFKLACICNTIFLLPSSLSGYSVSEFYHIDLQLLDVTCFWKGLLNMFM